MLYTLSWSSLANRTILRRLMSSHLCGEFDRSSSYLHAYTYSDSQPFSLSHPKSVFSEVVEKFPDLRSTITEKLTQTFTEIKSGKVFRGALWIVGEYVDGVPAIQAVFQALRVVLGEIPILASEQRLLDEAGGEEDGDASGEAKANGAAGGSKPRVLADGTYATESAYTSSSTARLEAVKAAAKPPLRSKSSFVLYSAHSLDLTRHY